MLRIGICDDEKQGREELYLILEQILHRKENDLYIEEFASGEETLSYMLEEHTGELDLLFLDIEMSGMGGMETARRLRRQDKKVILVFVTGYQDYVFDGYQMDALDYVMKPVKAARLRAVLQRALGKLHQQDAEMYVIQNTEGIYRIPREQILYFYSERRKVTAVTAAREYAFYGKLDEVEQNLGNGFVRIHQRYLVRAKAVDRVEDGQVWMGDQSLPISRGFHQKAMLEFVQVMLGGE